MAVSGFLNSLREDFTCPLCRGYFKEPMITGCGHNFCRACITEYWERFRDSFPCPQCGAKCPEIRLRPNRQLRNAVDRVERLAAQAGDRPCETHGSALELFAPKITRRSAPSAESRGFTDPTSWFPSTRPPSTSSVPGCPMANEDRKSSQALVKAEMSVSKAQSVREETVLRMKSYANWEEFLMPAPISISILGQLVFISAAQKDFSINKNPPKDGFKHIRYPESFRASLCQVSNQAREAFNTAHGNMDKIRLLSMSVPGRTKMIVKILFQDMETVNAMLPTHLKNMKAVADDCQALAKAVEDKYSAVIRLIQELMEACLNAKKGYEVEREKEQWEKMVRFFQMISCLSRDIKEFVSSVSDVQKIGNYSSNSFVLDMIYSQAFNASNVAHLVHMISETYTQVSNNFLMDRISSLGRLIALGPSDPNFNVERERLQKGCEEARQAIHDLVIETKEEFDRSVEARVETIDRELKAVLSPVSVAEQKAIEGAVRQGMKELAAEEDDQFA